MWNAPDFRRFLRGRGPRFALAAFLGLAPFAALPSAAAPQPAAAPPASAEERASLRQAIESRYDVLPVRDGIALTPRSKRAGVRTIEVTQDGVAVNGERVSARTLRDWLGADAEDVLRLQGLAAADQRQLFGLEGAPRTAVPAPPAPPEAPAAAEDEDGTPATTAGEVPEVATPETPAAPEEPAVPERRGREARRGSGSRVNVGGSVTVDRDEVAEEVVAIGGSATVKGEVENDVTAIGGPARVDGRVGGGVTSVGGSVYLGPNAVVEGDAVSVGGTVHREPGARVEGATNQVGLFPFILRGHRSGDDWEPWPFWSGFSELMGSLMFTVLLSLLVCLVLLVARVPLERVDRQLVERPWPSAAAGLTGVLFFWPLLAAVTILLAITVIGCALFLLYPFLFLYLVLLALLGFAAVAHRLGLVLGARFGRTFGSPYAAALVGVLAIQATSLLGHLLDLLPGVGILASFVGAIGFLVQLTAWVVGIGAVILARFGLAPGYWPPRGGAVAAAPVAAQPATYAAPAELPLSGSPEIPPPPHGGEPPASW